MKHQCPICKTFTDSKADAEFPFCSERCRLLDLGAWSSEEYFVSDPIFDEEDLSETDRHALHQRKPDEFIH